MHEQIGMDLGKISYEPQRVLQLKRCNTPVSSQSNRACTGSIVQSDLFSEQTDIKHVSLWLHPHPTTKRLNSDEHILMGRIY